MGIIANALTIILGGLFGSKLRKNITTKDHKILAIVIMIFSLVGFLENTYNIQGKMLQSENLIIVMLAFFIGSKLGDLLQIEAKLSNLSKTSNASFNAFEKIFEKQFAFSKYFLLLLIKEQKDGEIYF